MNQKKGDDRDRLTGFRTAEAVEKAFAQYLQEAADKEESLSVAIIDLDNFRSFNEKHGYGYGNGVLKRVADVILQFIPRTAITGRFGGEEFILLFPRTEREETFLVLERIRSECDRETEVSNGEEVILARCTISAGVAAYPADGTTIPDLLRKIEQALYRAKVSGRNRICIAQEEKMIPKTAHFTATQLERLTRLAKEEGVPEAVLLREALDCLLRKYTVSKKIA